MGRLRKSQDEVMFARRLGKAIYLRRKLLKLPRRVICERAGMSEGALLHIELGDESPRVHLLWLIATALGVGMGELV